MNDFQLAEQAIRQELSRIRGLTVAQEMLGKIGSLEQVFSERRGLVDVQSAELEKIRAAKAEAETARKTIARECAATLDTAKAEAERIITDAKAEAAEIIGEAQAKGAAMISTAEQRRSELAAHAERLENAIKAAR